MELNYKEFSEEKAQKAKTYFLKVFTIISLQGYANQNYLEPPPLLQTIWLILRQQSTTLLLRMQGMEDARMQRNSPLRKLGIDLS